MKCKHCNGTGKIRGYFYEKTGVNKWEKVWGIFLCDECNGTGEVEQTEQEYIQTCTTEQLAEWIAKIVDCDCCPVKRKFCDDNPCKIRFAEWLKQPHTAK